MDRSIVYAGQVPRALDNLLLGRFALTGLAKLSETILGTNTIVSPGSFAVTPGGGLNISIGPGQVYQLQSIEATTQSALNTDGHQVLKQGVALDAQTQTLSPPTTNGYAQNFLVQVAYQDVQAGQTVLSFQNPTPVLDPSTNAYKYVTYPGPGGSGAQSYTILQGGVSVIVTPGTAAPSGSQTTPAPNAGYVGLYVVTLAFGATTISSGNISLYGNAPFLPATLPGIPAGVQAGTWTFGQDTGTADNYAVTLSPNNGAPVTNQRIFVKFANANAGTSPVLNLNGTGNKALLKRDGTSPAVGDVPSGWRMVFYDGSAWRLEGAAASEGASQTTINNTVATAVQGLKTAPYIQLVAGTYTVTVPPGCTGCDSQVWGGGGGGGGVGSTSNGSGSAGGGGGYSFKTISGLTAGQTINLVVGIAGARGAAGGSGSSGGTTTFGSYHSATGGAGGTANGVGNGGVGGIGSGGDINIGGGYGSAGASTGVAQGGAGGSAPFGGQGGGGAPGIAGDGTVPGGAGGGSGSTTVNPGGAGAPGGCILRWK